ncbi:MAG TPA: phosphate acetyltransferase [Syntrophothermus lipocalidus]|uniref:Phosphate acetyltransferase n=1 Tax=Syntrophothermus lipocalidus (strain DSM 12680 / TGB-C1) TaxID=643648 RepID=D7CLU7_SYNLT|nr:MULTISPECIES: phosphate acetyltransferase [Syntrophothermus]ADI01682.1 phosphate acetyltransferase [Syntrophothermus lipocalidus DSM 12680]NSW84027.1 phosphate acetyltransferase [Syntrophothermus sp.]HHV77079.1 phosphate acetyltransferase [Syntrophothermus lipocalidus]
MNLLDQIKEKAKAKAKTIVLPEGTEERTLRAVPILIKEKIANPILLGDPKAVKGLADSLGVDLSGAEIINPAEAPFFKDFVQDFYEMRKDKGMTPEKAETLMADPLYFGSMMVKSGKADGEVAGAENTTGDVLRPALQIIKTAPGISSVSGAFIMIVPNCEFGDNGVFVFADCAVTPNPTAEQMAEFAAASVSTAVNLCGIKEPKIGMLSFSTKGSASHELVDKVAKATEIAKTRFPDLQVDGEFQADAALVPKVGASKAPGSPVAGYCNILIFPDLQAGNIGYKLVQRLAKAEAIGPILQGIAKPVNDLSRGCSVEDIVNVVAMTAVRA